MTQKTKKTLIIVAAVVVVAVIVYFVFFRKKSSTSIIDKLNITADQKAALKAKVAEIQANTQGIDGWTEASMKKKAAANGYTYDQWLVVEAAYALYYTSNWSLYETIGLSVKNL